MENIGLFIDGENVNIKDIDFIFDEIKKYGRIIINKIFLDFSTPNNWKNKIIEQGIEPIHCFKIAKKNSVDIKLIDNVLETLYQKKPIDIFILVSSDVDFLTLSHKVRSFGKKFFIFGYQKTTDIVKNTCDKFIEIEMLRYEIKKPNKEEINLENIFENDNFLPDYEEDVLNFLSKIKVIKIEVFKKYIKNKKFCEKKCFDLLNKKYNNSFKTFNQKIYNLSSIDSSYHENLFHQIQHVFFLNDFEPIPLSKFKEKMQIMINRFDQRLWGFSSLTEFITSIYNSELEIKNDNVSIIK